MSTSAYSRPGYLGRIMHAGGPVGTCFQTSSGVLITAWHVLDCIGIGELDSVVSVEVLAGGLGTTDATVVRIDPMHDLAVLTTELALPETVAGWSATDWVPHGTDVVVSAVWETDNPAHVRRHIDARGTWAGGTTRDREVPLGRLASPDVTAWMSGAPVRRLADDVVVGMVAARYNSADQWPQHSVWVTRVEDIAPLLDGVAGIEVSGRPAVGDALDVTITVTTTTVRLHGAGVDVTAAHRRVRPGLTGAIDDVRRERSRGGGAAETTTDASEAVPVGSVSLRRAGELVAESFLPVEVSDMLATVLRRADTAHVPVRIGIDAGPYPTLPWEAMPEPVTGLPLALHPLITVFRRVSASAVQPIPGPLQIIVAIAAPDEGGGAVLNYENELRNVLAAVRAARQADTNVRVVPFATTAAIHATFDAAPAHVLHLTGHGQPGALILEHDDGTARAVTAEELVTEAIPPGRIPPLISLAACYTDAPAAEDAPSFAAELLARGASAVIATETSVTDWYATALFARVYQELAQASDPDVVAAVAEARRIIQRQLSASSHPRDRVLAGLDEWSVVTVLAAGGGTRVFDPTVREPIPPQPRIAVRGLLTRGHGEFVGRRREQRRIPQQLTSEQHAGVVLHGIGGVGKTALAGQLIQHLPQGWLVTELAGELNTDAVLAAVAATIGRHVRRAGDGPAGDHLLRAAQYVVRVDEPWQKRFTVLREDLLDAVPLLLVLDNFEDNLTHLREVGDPMVGELLAAWVTDPGRSRLLVTSRYPFPLPDTKHTRLLYQPVGPLSRAETDKLIWSLPSLDRLDDAQLDRIWRLVGGHPRSLEYLDALLNHGFGRFPNITDRLTNAIDHNPETKSALTNVDIDATLAGTVTLLADDILLDQLHTQLSSAAKELLLGMSVYREPVDTNALLYQIGRDKLSAESIPDHQTATEQIITILAQHGIDLGGIRDMNGLPPDVLSELQPHLAQLSRPPRSTDTDINNVVAELAASSLLTVDPDVGTFFVHRWTATELHNRAIRTDRDPLWRAHAHAADYWRWRVQAWPQDPAADLHDLLEARHHLLEAGHTDQATNITEAICERLYTIGAWDHETTLIHDTLNRLDHESPRRADWHHELGRIAQARGDYPEAEHRYTVATTISEEFGNRFGMAGGYHQLGSLAHDRGDPTEAERQYTRALTIYKDLGDRTRIAACRFNLGILAHNRGDHAEAERQYTLALTIWEEVNNRAEIAASYVRLGILAHDRGDDTEAERRFSEALTIFENLGDRARTADVCNQLGILAHDRGDFPAAECYYFEVLSINEELGDRAGMAVGYHNLGAVAFFRDDYAEAERRYAQSLAIRVELGDRAGMAETYHNLGMLAQMRNDHDEAERRYAQSLAIEEELGNRAGIATSWSVLGNLAAETGRDVDAVAWHIRAFAARAEMQLPAARDSLQALTNLRRSLGQDKFTICVSAVVDSDSRTHLDRMLGTFEQ